MHALAQNIPKLMCIFCVMHMHLMLHGTFDQFIYVIRNHHHGASRRIWKHTAVNEFPGHLLLHLVAYVTHFRQA